jgi:hypothetical protein
MPSIPLPNQPYPDPTPADPNPQRRAARLCRRRRQGRSRSGCPHLPRTIFHCRTSLRAFRPPCHPKFRQARRCHNRKRDCWLHLYGRQTERGRKLASGHVEATQASVTVPRRLQRTRSARLPMLLVCGGRAGVPVHPQCPTLSGGWADPTAIHDLDSWASRCNWARHDTSPPRLTAWHWFNSTTRRSLTSAEPGQSSK